MKIKIEKEINILTSLRSLGYYPEKSNSFIKKLTSAKFPRFHIYYMEKTKTLNLHLDQKAPLYNGQNDHSGEYDTEVVKKEAERIKSHVSD